MKANLPCATHSNNDFEMTICNVRIMIKSFLFICLLCSEDVISAFLFTHLSNTLNTTEGLSGWEMNNFFFFSLKQSGSAATSILLKKTSKINEILFIPLINIHNIFIIHNTSGLQYHSWSEKALVFHVWFWFLCLNVKTKPLLA